MKRPLTFQSALIIIIFCISTTVLCAYQRFTTIEDFEDGEVTLLSWLYEDIAPSAWMLDSSVTYNNSAYSLKLTGNTWKQEMITPVAVDSGTVFQVACQTTSGAKYQGIGFSNGTHTLFYSFSGTVVLNIEQWVTVYQGAFSSGVWNVYQLPIADDWWAYFDELPIVTSIIYVNDLDSVSNRNVWFDSIINITSDIPVAPSVSISYNQTKNRQLKDGTKNVTVQFSCLVTDPDSDVFYYTWDFGDSTYSTLSNPTHNYTVLDDHPYRVILRVTDSSGKYGLATCLVNVDTGIGSLPITMNFVGDVMLARAYEQAGGIIPTYGVNYIFQPTKYLLGDAADITSANLEVVLCNVGTPHPTKSVVYRGNPANISGLVYAGIDIVTLANNHVIDYGLEGLQQMQGLLTQNGIIFNGSGANSYEAYTPALINKNGLTLAFLRSCDRTGQYNNAQPFLNAGYNKSGFALFTPYYLLQQLQSVDGIADLKIVEMHGGSEYSLTPGSGYDKNMPFIDEQEDEDVGYYTDVPHQWDIQIRHFAVDNGADIVICHHPHIIHGFEIYNGKLIAHSLGNFVFDLTYPETMPSLIFYTDVDFSGFKNYRVVPIFIDKYIPYRATGKLAMHILDYLAKRSRDLNTIIMINKDDLTASIPVVQNIPFTENQTDQQLSLTPGTNNEYYSDPIPLSRLGSISAVSSIHPTENYQVRLGQECIWYGNFENEGCSLWQPDNVDYNIKHEGTRSAVLTVTSATGSYTETIDQKLKWYNNTKKFTLHGWIKTQNATNANLEIRYYNNRTATNPISSESVTADLNGTMDWTFFSKEITVPSNAYYYILRCRLAGNANGNSIAWFDDCGLIEWTDWQPVSSYSIVDSPNDYYWMQIKAPSNPKSIRLSYKERDYLPTEVVNYKIASPLVIDDLQIFPNPFNPDTKINFTVKQDNKVKVSIYNLRGQLINKLEDSYLPAGKYCYHWNGKDKKNQMTATGLYFVKIQSGKQSMIKKILLLK